MDIVRFEPDMAQEVAGCYNELVAAVPFCEPVGGEWFADRKKRYRHPLAAEEILVARERGRVLGFADIGVAAPPTEDWHVKGEPGVIRLLSYRPGERPVGAALLDASEQWLRERDRRQTIAGDSSFMYPFYHLPFGHISERIAHLPPLFGLAGYEVPESEVFFAWEDCQPAEIALPQVDVEIEGGWQEQVATFGPGVALYVKQREKRAGSCEIVTLGSHQWRPALKDWCFCTSLYLDEPLQGKGLGKYLLSRGLREAKAKGLRHAMISTDWNNYRAYLFYANFGFGFLDRTFSFQKKLS
jgi:GNAT superfamily N-acetyltransferase